MDRRIIAVLTKNRILLCVLGVCCTITCLLELSIPYFLQLIVDSVAKKDQFGLVINYVYCFVGIILASIGPNYFTYIYSAKLVNEAVKGVFDLIIDNLENCSLNFFNGVKAVELAKQIENDTEELVNFCICNAAIVISNIFNLVGVLYLVSKISWKWIIVFFVIVIVHCLLMKSARKKLKHIYTDCKDSANFFFLSLVRILENIQSIKIHCIEKYFNEKYDHKYEDYAQNNVRKSRASFVFANSRLFLELVFYILLFTEGIREIKFGEITIGQFVALNGLFGIIVNAFGYFINLSNDIQGIVVANDRLVKLLDLKPDTKGSKKIDFINSIEFDNVVIDVPGRSNNMKHNFRFEKGKITCIVGANGIGKTTLLLTLVGLKSFLAGDIFYNDVSICDCDMEKIRKNKISFFEQNPLILEESIEYNVTLGKGRSHALSEMNLVKFVSEGICDMQKLISERTISGGEKHRIGIMRALLERSEVLVMDEPTSGLDRDGISNLCSQLKIIKKEKIVIIVSHDEEIIKLADEVICLSSVNKIC